MSEFRIVVLDGDGIGPEVNAEAQKVLSVVAEVFGIALTYERAEIGGSSIHRYGTPLTDENLSKCLAADAILLGAVGAPEFDELDTATRPEAGLLKLRKALGGYANLRPVFAIPDLLVNSPLRPEVVEGTDILIVRELLGGLYFGEPRGMNPDRTAAFNTMSYTSEEIRRIARIAFSLASKRRAKLTSVDKANVLETSRLWRDTINEVATEFPSVSVDHALVDSCAMRLVTNPSSFDVIVTENLFGDILSDEASILCGSLGMLSSATVGGKVDLYEPVHGSAPDIAGSDTANPLGAIESAALLLEHTLGNSRAADSIRASIREVLSEGFRTADIQQDGLETVTTSQMGTLVAERINNAASEADHSATVPAASGI